MPTCNVNDRRTDFPAEMLLPKEDKVPAQKARSNFSEPYKWLRIWELESAVWGSVDSHGIS